jgi:hypothetical protein
MNEKLRLLTGILSFFKFGFFGLFLIGIFLNADGVRIIASRNQYKPGILKIDSITGGAVGEVQESTIRGYGLVDSIHTGVILGNVSSANTQDILSDLEDNVAVLIPVWYKANGKLTLDRFPDEKEFPIERIYKKLFYNAVLFFGPFIVVLVWQIRLKRKLIKEDA